MAPIDFVEALSEVRLKAVFNPYSDRCEIHDRKDAPHLRRANLLASLEAALRLEIHSIWIARDLGYRGGRRTGLPLTDEVHLPAFSRAFGGITLSRATTGQAIGERTATLIWQILDRIDESIFLWNIFPLHPFEVGDPLSNRCHTRTERQACEGLLLALLDMLAPKQIVAIGRDAQLALAELGLPCQAVRHPSYGGQSAFIKSMAELYGLTHKPEFGTAQPVLP